VGSLLIVVFSPLLDDHLGFLEAVEDFAVEQLVSKLAIEAFVVAVLPRTTGRDEHGLRANPLEPITNDLCGHFGSVV